VLPPVVAHWYIQNETPQLLFPLPATIIARFPGLTKDLYKQKPENGLQYRAGGTSAAPARQTNPLICK